MITCNILAIVITVGIWMIAIVVVIIGGKIAYRDGFKSRLRAHGLNETEVERLWRNRPQRTT